MYFISSVCLETQYIVEVHTYSRREHAQWDLIQILEVNKRSRLRCLWINLIMYLKIYPFYHRECISTLSFSLRVIWDIWLLEFKITQLNTCICNASDGFQYRVNFMVKVGISFKHLWSVCNVTFDLQNRLWHNEKETGTVESKSLWIVFLILLIRRMQKKGV